MKMDQERGERCGRRRRRRSACFVIDQSSDGEGAITWFRGDGGFAISVCLDGLDCVWESMPDGKDATHMRWIEGFDFDFDFYLYDDAEAMRINQLLVQMAMWSS